MFLYIVLQRLKYIWECMSTMFLQKFFKKIIKI